MSWTRKIHKWASVFVGIQFLLWLVSGIYFNLMDHHKAGGHQYRNHSHHEAVIDMDAVVEPKGILVNAKSATSLKLVEILGKPYYLVNHEKGLYPNFKNRFSLFDAQTGMAVKVDEAFANSLARQSYSGPGEIIKTTLHLKDIPDFPKQKNPTWQVDFDDQVNTSVYVEAETGRIVGHSDDDKRIADIFFIIHFMDYAQQGSFNNWIMISFAFVTLWLAITGFIWSIELVIEGQYKVSFFAKQRSIKLFDKDNNSIGDVMLSTQKNLLHELGDQDIVLPSSCGGGGTCGRCRVMISPNAKVTSADKEQFNQDELGEGFRLACQHFADDVTHMTLMDVSEAKKHTLTLTDNQFISPDIKQLTFKVNGDAFKFKAGAFMRFLIPHGSGTCKPVNIPEHFADNWAEINDGQFNHDACSRSYSIANIGNNENELQFTIKMLRASSADYLPGVGSNFMGNLPTGSSIEALGPFEDFFVNENSVKTLVLVGAGSGMAPLKAIIEEQISTDKHIMFIYGARTEQDLIYQEYFYQLARDHKRFTYLPTLSKPMDKWLGGQGYVQDVLEMNLANFTESDKLGFYLCGPKGMMEETISLLKAKGFDDNQISFDDFS